MADIYFLTFGIGIVVVSVVGLLIDNYLDNKHGTSSDHYGNEVAHNTACGLLSVWVIICIIAGIILDSENLL